MRQQSAFRGWVRADGSTPYRPAPGRYHLYVSLACPWAHRTLIVRRLKRLEDVISLSVVDPLRDERGWTFCAVPGASADPVNGFRFLAEAHAASRPGYAARVTVPVLWDGATRSIVSNESADIVRMLGSEFDAFTDAREDLYPPALRGEIDSVNERVYATVNDGVYRCDFATSQAAYEEAVVALFESLDCLEERLGRQAYVAGERITEADWRLFTTLIRFDSVYYLHFKANLRRLVDHPRLWDLTRELYAVPDVAGTVDFDHIKRHYYLTHRRLNPSGIVPLGPLLDLAATAGPRRRLSSLAA